MTNPLNIFCRPKVENLQADELYQTERELLGLEEKAFRLKVALRQAEAALECTRERGKALRAALGYGQDVKAPGVGSIAVSTPVLSNDNGKTEQSA